MTRTLLRHPYRRAIWLPLLLALAACADPGATAPAATPGPLGNVAPGARDQRHAVPVTDESGRIRLLQARLCRPAGAEPARLVIQNCHPDWLAEAAGRCGATAGETPMLWVYAANDSYFSPAIATSLHRAFTEAGGKADFIRPGPFGSDGHRLFFGDGGATGDRSSSAI